MSDLPARAEALFFEGNRLLGADDAAAAERCYREALALAPDFAEALANLALLRDRAGALDEAEAAYRRVIALDPDGVQNRLNLGSMLARFKRFACQHIQLNRSLANVIQIISVETWRPRTLDCRNGFEPVLHVYQAIQQCPQRPSDG